MKFIAQHRRRLVGSTITTLVLAATLAPSAQARNVRLMEPVPDAVSTARVHDILGNLDLRFGGDSARGATLARRDVVVKGVGTTKLDDVGEDARVRPRDHELCARAFEDAITQLAFAARSVRGTAIVGVISNYEGTVFDDPMHYECHVGALKAAVTLRAQVATGPLAPSQAPMPVPLPATQPPVISPPPPTPDAPQPPAPTFQPLPPVSPPAPN